MSAFFEVSSSDHVTTVTLQQPTMPPAFFTDCQEVFEAIAQDSDVRAVVVRGAGKAFSYGLDLKSAFSELGPTLTGGGLAGAREELRRLILKLQGGFSAIAACPVPVIAATHGWCIGGGLDLISACDIRLGTEDSKISLRETKIAIVADIGSLQRLPGIIGKGAMRELAFTGKDVVADHALRIGLLNHVYPDAEALWSAADEMAKEIAGNAPLTVRGVKHVLDACEGRSIRDGLDYIATWNSAFLASEDLGEALSAFAMKRTPNYKGK